MTSPDTTAPPARTVFVEVSNTLDVDYVTGFQRHTRELLARLTKLDGPVRYVPVRWCTECETFRRLTGPETTRLAVFVARNEPARSRLASSTEFLPDKLKQAGRAVIHSKPGHAAREELARRRRLRNHPPEHTSLRIDEWPEDSWFFDLEAAWHNRPHRAELLPWLHRRGVRTATLVADVMPTQFPQWFDAGQIRLFSSFMEAHLRNSEKFVCISECSRRDVVALAERLGLTGDLDTTVITMGANFERADDDLPLPTEAPPGRYLLSVATVEPRKNHRLLIRAFDRLKEAHPDLSLVMVGKAGWMTEELQQEMLSHPDQGERFRWLSKVDDHLLDGLYRHAFLAVQPAFYEGFGTPVIEALGNGVPTLSSTGGALPEAGGEWAEYFDPDDVDELIELIERHLNDADYHRERRDALVTYHPPTWEQGAIGIATAFEP
ncbi:MAG: glycosyltransferase family 4 protein [Microthrixaceae bacterium]|nr:glycosyltransferase family 4 protein [Microthrixaceae bacterium]